MEKTYNPQGMEQEIYKKWEESGAFKPVKKEGAKPYTISMPPPNITGQLHMGHALTYTLPDVLIRYHRMMGDPTLWVPGTDHASIATEVKIVAQMAEEGITKEDIGREGFLKRAWAWKEEYGKRITTQLRRLGASCDWSRERFTMDEGCSIAVREVFVRLYEQGLIYRGDRIINWCPDCMTALSDAEIEYEEQMSHLWYLRYPAADGGEGVVVATTRPETMLGDSGVAVNPNDERFKHLIGKTVILPIVNREIPVVADEYVDMKFGTGAVKMTPAHDPNDFEVGQRHNLEIIKVINDDGTMAENTGKDYAGLTREEARKKIVQELEKQGFLVKIEDYSHNVGTCYRCGTTVEPLISKQWFVKMEPLAKPAIKVVREGEIRFLPERFSKTYFNWMENIRDWCISRQLWWGHRIPAWYCDECGEVIVSREDPVKCPKCGSEKLRQDEDVLDTWFSSALWPFSTLGWPEETEDFKYFYPTSTMVTGYDIIFFWVARMIFSGLAYTGKIPFDKVLIHGLVRDEKGRKMSKSLGNGVDPLEAIDKFGADALRFTLCMGVSIGNDIRYSDSKIESSRNFANKIWNATRFVLMNLDGEETIDGKQFELADKWILNRAMQAVKDISKFLDSYEHGLSAERIYDFAWSDFCDWYIELSKADLFGEDLERKKTVRAVLQYVLSILIKLLHPFMPFITETIYSYLPGKENESCMLSSWPEYKEEFDFVEEADKMQGVMDIIRSVRNLRAEMRVQAGRKARLMLKPHDGWGEALSNSAHYFEKLANVSELQIIASPEDVQEKTVSAVTPAAEIFMPLGDLVDISEEISRIKKEIEKTQGEIKRSQGKLNNQGFISKAPKQLIEAEEEKLKKHTAMLDVLKNRLNSLEA
ncbi:MAG: valine--tRNA ligase [Eubacteriales bacterium]|nr:valine--tRNA ligase [Eubacteriales bacterium]